MIEFNRLESPHLSLREVATEFKVHLKTVYGWCSPVDHLKRPKRFLKTFQIGGRRYTTRAHLAEFAVDGPRDSSATLNSSHVTTDPPAPNLPSAPSDTPSSRKPSRFEKRQIEAAKLLQDRFGIKVKR
jgi:hypothetical protein